MWTHLRDASPGHSSWKRCRAGRVVLADAGSPVNDGDTHVCDVAARSVDVSLTREPAGGVHRMQLAIRSSPALLRSSATAAARRRNPDAARQDRHVGDRRLQQRPQPRRVEAVRLGRQRVDGQRLAARCASSVCRWTPWRAVPLGAALRRNTLVGSPTTSHELAPALAQRVQQAAQEAVRQRAGDDQPARGRGARRAARAICSASAVSTKRGGSATRLEVLARRACSPGAALGPGGRALGQLPQPRGRPSAVVDARQAHELDRVARSATRPPRSRGRAPRRSP